MSKFFCDTNSEVALDVFKALNIDLIKMPYTVNGEQSYYDLGEDTDLKAFFKQMRDGAMVKTQALNEFDYIDYFEPVFAAGQDILYVTFSHKMSATFLALDKAAETLKAKYPQRKITTVDTKGISVGAGVLVVLAAKAHNNGASDDEVVRLVEALRDKTKTYFTVESLEYLKRGGRLSRFKTFIGTMLNVKPIITVTDGALVSSETAKGRKAALRRLAAIMQEDNADVSCPIGILHADCYDDAVNFKGIILENFPAANIYIRDVGPVVGCHCGPGTIGLAFLTK